MLDLSAVTCLTLGLSALALYTDTKALHLPSLLYQTTVLVTGLKEDRLVMVVGPSLILSLALLPPCPSLILSLTLLATLVMAATTPPKSKTFPLRQLPSVPLMHILHLLPHSALANLAATCTFYHTTLHSSPSLWRRLDLLPTVVAPWTEGLSFRAMLRNHGSHITAVRVKMVSPWPWRSLTLVVRALAVNCPHLRHLAITYINLPPYPFIGNPLKLIVNSLPHLASLEVRQIAYSAGSSARRLEHLAEFKDLTHLALSVLNTRETGRMLAAVFSELHNLRKVTLQVSGRFQGSPLICSDDFLSMLITNNLRLEEVELDTQIHVTSKMKAMLMRRGVTLRQG